VASRGAGGESGFSKAALAIPREHRGYFRTCVEKPSMGSDGQFLCSQISPYDPRRVVLKWNQPPIKPYHPVTATNADGTLGYLQGTHTRFYTSACMGKALRGTPADSQAFRRRSSPSPGGMA